MVDMGGSTDLCELKNCPLIYDTLPPPYVKPKEKIPSRFSY
jgi:hypothetical protein